MRQSGEGLFKCSLLPPIIDYQSCIFILVITGEVLLPMMPCATINIPLAGNGKRGPKTENTRKIALFDCLKVADQLTNCLSVPRTNPAYS
jgi:hypothetical protein